MDTQGITVFTVVNEYNVPFAITTDAAQAEEILAEWISEKAYEIEDEDFDFEENTDATVWEETLEEFLDCNPDLLTKEQIKELLDGETILV
jgi:hypothetical protein